MLAGFTIATGGALWARPWWKAAILITFGLGYAAWGRWRGASSQERRR
jgi:hypothetical protein